MWQPQGFYNEYTLRTPVILAGDEAVKGLYNYPASKIAVIHGSSFFDEKLFLSVFSKREVRFFMRSWKEEPDFEGIKGTVGDLEDYRPDTIIAVGGGSVIDGSKLCRLLYEFPFFEPKASRVDGHMIKTQFVAVPTTVGSGAEVSSAAVYIDSKEHRKDMVVMHELQPDVIVYDSRYVNKTPPRLLCASALDAMTHIVEGYVSNVENSFLDVLAEEGLSLLHEELDALVSGQDVEYRRLQYAGYIGGVVQNHCIVGVAHAVAHQLAEQGYSHGEAVALLLPAAIKTNMSSEYALKRYCDIAERAGFNGVDEMISFINRLLDYSGISDRRDIMKECLERLKKDQVFLENVKNDRGGKGNPVEITEDIIGQLIGSI